METVRERILRQEQLILSPYAQLAKDTWGREYPEEECNLRTCYQKDRDKIIHCKSFRRLKQKTQVFISPEGDHYRTRLTHTLEVGQIGRTICRALALNEDLCEAIAMGHDLGHTPFGHAGERALNALNPDGFSHSKQSGRVVRYLERNLRGLNLCKEVINGIENHTRSGNPLTREGIVLRFADRIAYLNHDIEDAITAGILTEDDLPKECTDVLGHTKSERITTLINSLVENSWSEIKMAPEIQTQFEVLSTFMYDNVYTDSIAKTEEKKVDILVAELYRYFKQHPEKMPDMYHIIAREEGLDRAVTDYIQGMSDDFASVTFQNIFIPKPWKLGQA
ncbi:MAG: deoxyguanosinetriphosphate triphosphohydrolase [Oscillospiraceae bacterium]|nr:deoxyguanosinetriphosphate triphosphohydrolase [Oscillospiraceae bacterium]